MPVIGFTVVVWSCSTQRSGSLEAYAAKEVPCNSSCQLKQANREVNALHAVRGQPFVAQVVDDIQYHCPMSKEAHRFIITKYVTCCP